MKIEIIRKNNELKTGPCLINGNDIGFYSKEEDILISFSKMEIIAKNSSEVKNIDRNCLNLKYNIKEVHISILCNGGIVVYGEQICIVTQYRYSSAIISNLFGQSDFSTKSFFKTIYDKADIINIKKIKKISKLKPLELAISPKCGLFCLLHDNNIFRIANFENPIFELYISKFSYDELCIIPPEDFVEIKANI